MSSWNYAALLFVINALFGSLAGVFLGNKETDLVINVVQVLAVAGVIFSWALLDARRNGRKLTAAQGLCIVLFGYAAVPFYLGFYRESKHWLRWTIKGTVILIGCFGLFALSALLASGSLA